MNNKANILIGKTKFIFIFFGLISCNANFDSEKWNLDPSVRQEQADDLMESEILINKSYNEIVQILGETDIDSRQGDSTKSNENFTIHYVLGGCNYIDFERLTIEFENERSTEVYKSCD